jgi:hypothetical protein
MPVAVRCCYRDPKGEAACWHDSSRGAGEQGCKWPECASEVIQDSLWNPGVLAIVGVSAGKWAEGFGCPFPPTNNMLDVVAQIVFGAGAVIAIWLPVYAYQAAVRSIHAASPDE